MGGPADEVVIEPKVASDPGLGRRVDRPVLTEPCPVALLEPQGHQRPHPEQPQAVRLAGRHDPVEQLALVLGRDPQLIAEVTGVVDSGEKNGRHPEVDPSERHERERLGRQVEVRRDRREHLPRPRARDRQPGQPQAEHLEPDRPVARQVVAEADRAFPARIAPLAAG